MKCPVCGSALKEGATRSPVPKWVLWTNILVLPTIGLGFALRYHEDIGAWSLILGFAGTVYGITALRNRTTHFHDTGSAGH